MSLGNEPDPWGEGRVWPDEADEVINRGLAAVVSILAATGVWLLPAAAEEGVAADRILFGQSAALTGPAAELGLEMQRGILAAFGEANAAGGIAGRRIELITRDDRYEPEAAIANTGKLIGEDRVFGLIGAVGTPTSAATEPIAREAGVPFIAPFTGAEFLRDPALTNVANIRASYFEETEAIVDRLVEDRGVTRIAVLFQDDSYGRSGLAGVRRALERRNMTLAGAGSYVRNTTAVKTALLALRGARPEAIIIIGAYLPSAVFTQWARKLGVDATIVNISFVGANALAEALGPAGDGVYVTQVVPFPEGDAMPLLREYRAALAALDPAAKPGFGSLEGYIAGRLTTEVLRRLGREPTRLDFLAALAGIGAFDIGGFILRYGPGDNHGSDQVFLTMISRDGSIVPVEDMAR
jgi:branched-chain amino acid transport system substrate-binding protein